MFIRNKSETTELSESALQVSLAVRDPFKRLLSPSLETEFFQRKSRQEAITFFRKSAAVFTGWLLSDLRILWQLIRDSGQDAK